MDEAKELYERYLEVYDKEEDKDEIREILKDEFLKDEMEDLLASLDIEIQTGWTKDDMADQMLSVDFYEVVKGRLGKYGEEKEESEPEVKEEKFEPSKFFEGFTSEGPRYIKKFWEDMQKEVDKNLPGFKISPEKYWLEIEELWEEQSQVIKKNIERLARTELPDEDVDRLKAEWNKFSEEMNFHLKEIPLEIELRRETLNEIIEEHTEESRKIIADTDRKIRELYPLWFDMIKDIREELEEGRSSLEDKEEQLYDTWDEFSGTISEELKKMAEENETAENLLKKWSMISDRIDEKISKVPEKHDDIYRDFWENLGKEKPKLAKKIEELSEFTERDYMESIENLLEPIRSTYEKMIKPKETEKDKKISDLESRIAELEEKLEEK